MNQLLVVMRLADMARVHPNQDNNRVCAHCGHQVGIYPSGQAALEANPALEITCQVCAEKQTGPSVTVSAPGALDEVHKSVLAPKKDKP